MLISLQYWSTQTNNYSFDFFHRITLPYRYLTLFCFLLQLIVLSVLVCASVAHKSMDGHDSHTVELPVKSYHGVKVYSVTITHREAQDSSGGRGQRFARLCDIQQPVIARIYQAESRGNKGHFSQESVQGWATQDGPWGDQACLPRT